jgi:hypothetical protein
MYPIIILDGDTPEESIEVVLDALLDPRFTMMGHWIQGGIDPEGARIVQHGSNVLEDLPVSGAIEHLKLLDECFALCDQLENAPSSHRRDPHVRLSAKDIRATNI